jgi:hypothetical protein
MTRQQGPNVHTVAASLPDIGTLRRRCQAMAMLDAILCPDPVSRYHSYIAQDGGLGLATMSNGSGDEYSIGFSPAGVFIYGFDHESPMSPVNNDDELWPGLLDGLYDAFDIGNTEPAFSYDGDFDATFCLWRLAADSQWQTGVIEFPETSQHRIDPDGSSMLAVLCDDGQTYRAFAAGYYEKPVDAAAVTHVYALKPLTAEIVSSLNPALFPASLAADLQQTGYPKP